VNEEEEGGHANEHAVLKVAPEFLRIGDVGFDVE